MEGYRPIQCAVMSLHADVHAIDKLLEHDPSQVEVIDGEGNGLLHHAKGQKVSSYTEELSFYRYSITN